MKYIFLLFLILLLTGCTLVKNPDSQISSNIASVSENKEDPNISSSHKELCEEAAERFSVSVNHVFESGETIQIDDLMSYFTVFHMRDEEGKLLPELEKYRTNNGLYEIKIPKNIVNDVLSSIFMVALDDSISVYYKDGDTENYVLDAEVRDMFYFECTNFDMENGNNIIKYDSGWIDPDEDGEHINIEGRFELGIKVISEEKFQYVFCRKIS